MRSPGTGRSARIPQLARAAAAGIFMLLASPASAARIGVQIEGVDGQFRDAVKAAVEAAQYANREVSEAQVQRLHERAQAQAQKALEPWGYFEPKVKSELRQDGERWLLVLQVTPGEVVRVRSLDLRLDGDADGQKPVQKALAAFVPGKGQPLDQSAYEKSKARLHAALVATGYLDAKLVTHQVEVSRATASADIHLAWQVGQRYRFGATHFDGAQLPDAFLQRFVPWREGDFYTQERLLAFQQRLIDADYFSIVEVQPNRAQAHADSVPIEVALAPAKRSVYTGGLFVGTDTGPGLRGGMRRRWINRRGHKLLFDTLLAQRLRTSALEYQIPLAGLDNHSLSFGVNYRDEDTDTSTSRTFGLAATDSRIWHGWTRNLGLKFLTGDFRVANVAGNTTLLYPEATFTRKLADDPMFVRRGWSLTLTARAAAEGVLADTSFVQAIADGKWIRGLGENGRLIARATFGATAVGDFQRLPPELRFFAGGDRSIRGYGYQTIGPPLPSELVPVAEAWCTARAGRGCQSPVVGGRNLAVLSAEYEYYFLPDWGIAAFVDTGDAFDGPDDYRQKIGVGIGARWRSPVGMIRVDFGFPVHDRDRHGLELHIVIGPDL